MGEKFDFEISETYPDGTTKVRLWGYKPYLDLNMVMDSRYLSRDDFDFNAKSAKFYSVVEASEDGLSITWEEK
jgi:hypothetical protein